MATAGAVELADGDNRAATRGVVIANGHNWDPQHSRVSGPFRRVDVALVAVQNARRAPRAARVGRGRGQFGLRHRGRSGAKRGGSVSQRAPRLSLPAQVLPRQADRPVRRTAAALAFAALAAAQDHRAAWCDWRRRAREISGCRRPTTGCSKRIRSSIRRCCITSGTARSRSSPTSPSCAARTSALSTAASEPIDVIDLCDRLSDQLSVHRPGASELVERSAASCT